MSKKTKYYGMFGSDIYDFNDKESCVNKYISYMLIRSQELFRWNNLPDSIPQRSIELYLQTGGHCAITKVNDELYALVGGLGGEPDPYYMPTLYTVANPALNFSKNLVIDEDCVVIPNDALYIGLIPMYSRYATQLMENDISMRLVDINTRITSLLSASDDRTKASAEKYVSDIEDGKLGVVAETALLDGIKSQPYSPTGLNQMTNLIEYHQYLKASWFNEIGLNANYNMKRESINSEEAQLNSDSLLPLIDNMLLCRQQAAEKINAMFGTNISVELASAWEDNQEELDAELDALENESGENSEDNNEEVNSSSNKSDESENNEEEEQEDE